jgi:hypothetical protein
VVPPSYYVEVDVVPAAGDPWGPVELTRQQLNRVGLYGLG